MMTHTEDYLGDDQTNPLSPYNYILRIRAYCRPVVKHKSGGGNCKSVCVCGVPT